MSKYILAHDLGTSGNKATIYDFEGRLKAFMISEYKTYYPSGNHVEQSPDSWWNSVCESTKNLLASSNIKPSEISAVTFSGQMMGCVLVDKNGDALRNAIIWADSRSEAQEKKLRNEIDPWQFYKITGHRPAAFYSLCKLLWVKENEPEIYKKTHKMLQAKDFIIYKLTGNYVTDYSDASSTNILDIEKKVWSKDIIKAAGINEDILSELHSSLDIVGHITDTAASATGLLSGTPVVAGGGDGSCAAVGAGVVNEGSAYIVIGSSSWISNVSKKPVFDTEMKTFNWVALDPECYTPCGTMQAAGYSVSWLKNTLCEIDQIEANESDTHVYDIINKKIAASPPGANDVIYLPYLLGERSPRWNANAKGAFMGLTMTTSKNDMMRAVYEGVGYNLKVILEIISKDNPTNKITAIGGGAKSDVWLQILADIWQKPVQTLTYLEEATSMGAAVCAGCSIGVFESFDVINKFNKPVKLINPNKNTSSNYERLYNLFNKLYNVIDSCYK